MVLQDTISYLSTDTQAYRENDQVKVLHAVVKESYNRYKLILEEVLSLTFLTD